MLPNPLPQQPQRLRVSDLEARVPARLPLVFRPEGDVDLLAAGGDVEPGFSVSLWRFDRDFGVSGEV